MSPLANHPSRPDRVWRSQAAMNEPRPSAYEACPNCGGSGLVLGPYTGEPDWCRECDGNGVVRARDERGRFTTTDLEAILKAAPNREVWLEAKRQYLEASDADHH